MFFCKVLFDSHFGLLIQLFARYCRPPRSPAELRIFAITANVDHASGQNLAYYSPIKGMFAIA
jgi:hypothetical protein